MWMSNKCMKWLTSIGISKIHQAQSRMRQIWTRTSNRIMMMETIITSRLSNTRWHLTRHKKPLYMLILMLKSMKVYQGLWIKVSKVELEVLKAVLWLAWLTIKRTTLHKLTDPQRRRVGQSQTNRSKGTLKINIWTMWITIANSLSLSLINMMVVITLPLVDLYIIKMKLKENKDSHYSQ